MAKVGNLENEVVSLQRQLLQQKSGELKEEEAERGTLDSGEGSSLDKGERNPLEKKLLMVGLVSQSPGGWFIIICVVCASSA